MCGLIFAHRPDSSADALRGRAEDALNRLLHRGPDDGELWLEEGVVVGHRRLAIVDLEASRQPMSDPEGRYVLAYNGELYNYRELRERLKGRWRFRTGGDTEVVLAGLILEGEAFFSAMEGMWALALWDRKERGLLLARDRMGKKPLYYREGAGGLSCASELPALRALDGGAWREDLDATADYLRYGYYLPGTTAYRDVHEVPPGHTLRWTPGGAVSEAPYWRLSLGRFDGGRRAARERLRDTLRAAVERRMVADVEVGAFLSGGVDSSLVVGLMVEELGVRPQTFTIGFSEAAFDERPFATLAAERWRTRHHEQCLDGWDGERLRRLVLDHVGQPFADSSLLPTALVSELAARHVKVALSGDGGDELFSGYQRYQARAIMRWYTRLPRGLRGLAERAIRALPEPMAHHSRSVLKKAHLFLDVAARAESETPYVAPLAYSAEAFSALAPELVGRGHRPPGMPEESRLDDIQAMMSADALVYLPQDILLKVDRASMAHSLETRAPFLDREVVELAFSLPRHWHRRGMSGKRMLRESFGGLLPEVLWKRRKQGFAVPVHQWFRSGMEEQLRELLADDAGPLEGAEVARLIGQHVRGARDHGYRLWAIYIYLLWRRGVA